MDGNTESLLAISGRYALQVWQQWRIVCEVKPVLIVDEMGHLCELTMVRSGS
jgi:hypothetical protein